MKRLKSHVTQRSKECFGSSVVYERKTAEPTLGYCFLKNLPTMSACGAIFSGGKAGTTIRPHVCMIVAPPRFWYVVNGCNVMATVNPSTIRQHTLTTPIIVTKKKEAKSL